MILIDMRKPGEIYFGAKYHVTARINRDEFVLESKEVKELFLQTVIRAKKKYLFQLRSFTIMDKNEMKEIILTLKEVLIELKGFI